MYVTEITNAASYPSSPNVLVPSWKVSIPQTESECRATKFDILAWVQIARPAPLRPYWMDHGTGRKLKGDRDARRKGNRCRFVSDSDDGSIPSIPYHPSRDRIRVAGWLTNQDGVGGTTSGGPITVGVNHGSCAVP